MVRKVLLFSILSVALEITTGHAGKSVCRISEQLEHLNRRIRDFQLPFDVQMQMETIWKNHSLTLEEQSSLAFELFFKTVARSLSPKTFSRLQKIVDNDITYFHDTELRGGISHQDLKIYLVLPKELVGSPANFFILWHELVHAISFLEIQDLGLSRVFNRSVSLKYHPLSIFEIERTAMTGEWLYVDTVPKRVRSIYVKRLSEMSFTTNESRDFVIRILESLQDSPDLHVQNEWRYGRYSREALTKLGEFNRRQLRKGFYTVISVSILSGRFLHLGLCAFLYKNQLVYAPSGDKVTKICDLFTEQELKELVVR